MLCHHQHQHSATERASLQKIQILTGDPDPDPDPVPPQICTLNYKLKSLKVLKAFAAKRQRRRQKVNTIKA